MYTWSHEHMTVMKKPKQTWKFSAPMERMTGRFAWSYVEFPHDVKELFGKRGDVRVKTPDQRRGCGPRAHAHQERLPHHRHGWRSTQEGGDQEAGRHGDHRTLAGP
ncbi:MAG: DUF1905 domain-containing protein [Flavobacteriales bacterium]|nr:DUF1905 domain-containing protein [Flavobacteriales bacterium]